MEDLFFYFLVGMVGGDIANDMAKNNKKFKLPIPLIFSISFSTLYVIGLLFFAIVYFLKGYEIPWKNLSIFCLAIAFLISIFIFVLERIRKN